MSLITVPSLLKHLKCVSYVPMRWSQWSPDHVPPVIGMEKMKQLEESGQLKELSFRKIKAAQPMHTESLFRDYLLNKFMNVAMMKGKRSTIKALMIETFANIKRIQIAKYHDAKTPEEKSRIIVDPLVIFHTAVDNCKPLLVTKGIKRGGATYQVPYPVTEYYSTYLSMKWIRDAVRERPKPRKTHFPEEMAKELIDAFYNDGKVVRRKQEMHRLCENNKAYAHYRWG